jgi:hypothetical protein
MSDIHGAVLDIRHATTSDCPDGAPWPPAGDGWVMVRRANGFTFWRSIQLDQMNAPAATATPVRPTHRRQP